MARKKKTFALSHVKKPAEYLDHVIFCDKTQIMMYYDDVPSKVWRKPNTGLQHKNIILTVKVLGSWVLSPT